VELVQQQEIKVRERRKQVVVSQFPLPTVDMEWMFAERLDGIPRDNSAGLLSYVILLKCTAYRFIRY
jgi:hypothetical protein